MKESRFIYFCDSCYTEKNGVRKDLDPDSVDTCVYRQPFRCVKKEQWIKHLQTNKHCRNVATNNNIKDELINECKHCNVRLDDRSYKIHTQRNYMLWASKGFDWTKDCSCNNFIYEGKRFNTFGALREYVKNIQMYSYGKQKKIDYRKKMYDVANKICQEKDKHVKEMLEARKRSEDLMRKELADKRAKEAKEIEEKRKKNRQLPVEEKKEEETPITITIEDEFNKLNGIEEKEDSRTDLCFPPEWNSEDICDECGKPDNSFREYSEQKLKNYEVKLCDCEDSDSDDSLYEKII